MVTTKYPDLASQYLIPTTNRNNLVSHYDNLLTCGNDILSCGNDLLTCGNDVVSCSNDLLTCGNELKTYRKTVLCPFLGSVNTSESKSGQMLSNWNILTR